MPCDVSRILQRWNEGDSEAAAALFELLHNELKRLAAGLFRRERATHTLQPTALVNEAYLRIAEASGVRFENQVQFLGFSAHVMRRVLAQHSRHRGRARRGGGQRRVTLAEETMPAPSGGVDLLALENALVRLERIDPQKVAIVELRCFGGLTIEETSRHLEVSVATVARKLRAARAWLHRELKG